MHSLRIAALFLIAAGAADAPDRKTLLQDVIRLTNDERAKHKLPPVKEHALLSKVAQAHSDNMAGQKKMAHELDGKAPADRVKAAGYKYSAMSENVAEGHPNAAAVVAGWMASPGHRANVLDGNATEIGVGVASDADGRPYYTQVFGRPLTRVANAPLGSGVASQASKASVEEVVKLLNAERVKAGLPVFKVNPILTEIAGRHAASMAKAVSFQDGFKPYGEAEKAGYRWSAASEVLSAGTDDAKTVVDGWLKGDNRKVVLGDAADIGCGVGYTSDGVAYVAVLFAKPR